jgi:hypothetical protein
MLKKPQKIVRYFVAIHAYSHASERDDKNKRATAELLDVNLDTYYRLG